MLDILCTEYEVPFQFLRSIYFITNIINHILAPKIILSLVKPKSFYETGANEYVLEENDKMVCSIGKLIVDINICIDACNTLNFPKLKFKSGYPCVKDTSGYCFQNEHNESWAFVICQRSIFERFLDKTAKSGVYCLGQLYFTRDTYIPSNVILYTKINLY